MRKAIRRTPILVLWLAAALSGCSRGADWLVFRGYQGLGHTPNAVRPPLGVRWKLSLQDGERGAYAFNNPVISRGVVYFGSTDGNFYALDLESGYMRWVFRTGAAINSIPTADDHAVYFGSNDGRVYALDLQDGTKLWDFNTGRTVQSVVVRYEDYVVFTSDGGATYFLSPDGIEQFNIPNPVWHYHTFQIYDDHVYFAPGPLDNPLSFGVFDIRTRTYRWVLDTAMFDTHWYSFGALYGDSLFFSTGMYDGFGWELGYYAFDRHTGRLLWSYFDRASLPPQVDPRDQFERNLRLLDYMAPAIVPSLFGTRVIYSTGDDTLRAFDAHSGSLVWQTRFESITTCAAIAAGDRIYVGLAATNLRPSRLVSVSARDGRLLWELEVDGNILSPPVISDRWMIFGTDRNVVYVLEEVLR